MIENYLQLKDQHLVETFGEIEMTKAYMIIDMQFGSTGKGLLAGYLAVTRKPDVVATAWGPNAGHTYIDGVGRKYVHRMLANGVVSPNLRAVLIGPGSVIDLECLAREITECQDHLKGKMIVIHPQAVVLTENHVETERRNVKIGSTMKGTGAAVISRIERDPDADPTAAENIPNEYYDKFMFMGISVLCSAEAYARALKGADVVQIEGAQGFSLSIYHGPYPYTTSRDVTPAQVMADCAIPVGMRPKIYGTLRTFPIRVANRYDESGTMVGTSGPCYIDQRELTWDQVGQPTEYTTVTKLPRRIFSFSYQQLQEATWMCSPDAIFLNFCNYLKDEAEVGRMLQQITSVAGAPVIWLGKGPTVNDVYEIGQQAND